MKGGIWPAHGVTSGISSDCFHYLYLHLLYKEAETTNNAENEEDNNDEMFDDYWGLEMDGCKRDDQVSQNEDGMEEDVDIPD